jgi:hypothetical protein
LILRNGPRPGLQDAQDEPQGIDKLLAATAIGPPHSRQAEKNQEPLQLLADRQASWLTRRLSISPSTAWTVARLAFGEVRP